MFDSSGADWRFEVYMAGIGRMHDYRNYDFIKHKAQVPEVMQKLYKQFGILNLFCPHRPNGAYLLNLGIYEERIVCKILLELTKCEGIGNMQEIKVNNKAVEKVSNEFIKSLPTSGMFEGTYLCPPEKEDFAFRESLGAKYLDWEV